MFKNKITLQLQESDLTLTERLTEAETDTATGQLLQLLKLEVDPDPDFVRQLELRLRAMNRPQSPSQPLLEARTKMQLALRGNKLRLASAVVVVVSLIMVGLVASFTFFQPSSVRAAEIMTRAAQLSSGSDSFGLQSYHGKLSESGKPGPNELYREAVAEVWFLAPNSRRIETRTTDTGGKSVQYLSGTNGSSAWSYNPDQNLYTQLDPGAGKATSNFLLGATDLTTLLQTANRYYNVALVGSEVIAGRPAYIIEMTPKQGASGSAPLYTSSHMKFWIDQQNYLELGVEYRDAQNKLLAKMIYTQLELNPTLDTTLFQLDPPKGAKIEDERPPSLATLDISWQEAANQVTYKLFRPSFIPAGLTAALPQFKQPRPGVLNANYAGTQPPGNIYNLNELIIMEGPTGTWQLPKGKGEAITVGRYAGAYLKEGDLQHIFLEVDGTAIAVTGDAAITKDQLIQVVASLQPAVVTGSFITSGK